MAIFELQYEIEAPPEVVFDLLADHTKYPLWRPDISEAKLFTERPIRKGSKGMTRGESGGREYVNDIDITNMTGHDLCLEEQLQEPSMQNLPIGSLQPILERRLICGWKSDSRGLCASFNRS